MTRAAKKLLQAVVAMAVGSAAAPAIGDVLYWDPNGAALPNPAGGAGTWSANSNNWWNGISIQQYDQGIAPHDAIFSASGGAVNVSGTVVARSLTFIPSAYTLSGGTINLVDAGEIGVTTAGFAATISGTISGVELTKVGAGVLTLSGTNSFTGVNVRGGSLEFSNESHLGAAGGDVKLDGGSVRYTGSSSFSTPRNFIIGPAGGGFSSATSNNFTIAGILSGTGPLMHAGGTLRLDNADHTFAGGLRIAAGTFRFNNNNESGPKALRMNRVTLNADIAASTLSLGGNGGSSTGEGSELRTGEWSSLSTFASIIAATTTTDTVIGAHGHDLMVFALADATYAGSVSNLITSNGGAAGANSTHGELQIRGIATQTLTGTVNVNNTITLSGTGGLRLANNAVLTGSGSKLHLKGGTLTLDNTTTNNADRFNDTGAIDVRGGGTVLLAGHSTGSTETLGQLQLGNPTAARSGHFNAKILASSSAAQVLTFASLQRDSGRATIDFSARALNPGNGLIEPVPLGQSGNNPRIMFTSAPSVGAGGLLSDGGGGFATINGADFATYAANGVTPVTTTAFSSAGAGDNALLTDTQFISTTKSLASLKIAPPGDGRSLNINGSAALDTSAVLHTGANPYTITGITTGGLTASATRHFFVQQSELAVNVKVTGSGALVKSGDGTLILNTANNYGGPTTINAGALRIAGNTSLGANTLELRGGVLEIAGGGTFNRHLDQGQGSAGTPGLLSWTAVGPGLGQTSETDRGRGGFAAFGSPVTIDINGLGPTDLNWEEPSFLSSGYALILGSENATSTVSMIDNIGFGLGVSAYNTREIRVIDNPNSIGDSARITGIIYSDTPANGGRLHDLLKSGDGTLELAGNNTYYGGTIIAEGTIIAGHNNALGHASAPYVLLGNRGGSASAALLANAGVNIARDITIQSGGTGAVSLGGNNTTGVATFSGKTIVLRNVNLTAAAGGNTHFTGAVENPTGKTITKTGAGVVTISGAQSHGAGAILNTTAGTLNLNSDGGPNLTVNVNGSTNFGASQNLAALNVGAGTIATATVVAGGDKAIRTPTLTFGTSSKLDLKDNKLIVPAGDVGSWNGTNYTGITGNLRSGRNNGAWNGRGLITTMSDASSSSMLTTLAVATASQANKTIFGDMSVAPSDVLVMYTYAGDANLSGHIDADDFFRIDSGFNARLKGYFNGDFNYSGAIDADDYWLIDRNYSRQGESLGLTAVPEPSAALALTLVAALTLRRRRKSAAALN